MSNRIVQILEDRDNMHPEEAAEIVAATRKECRELIAAGEYEEAIDWFQEELGLELDYMEDWFGPSILEGVEDL